MNRKSFKSHFKFNKQERSGIFFLLLAIVILQILYFVGRTFPTNPKDNSLVLDKDYQIKIDALKKQNLNKDSIVIFPFNPNYISDYKGYVLGMSTEEIDRLHAFRAKNQFANSSMEFQKVTLISDSLLDRLEPYFKFPEWTHKVSGASTTGIGSSSSNKLDLESAQGKNVSFVHNDVIRDLNQATAEELKSINGIGDKLSQRIIKFRDLLGGFIVESQLGHVYGLDSEVTTRILGQFRLLTIPSVGKININQASPGDISKLVYIKYSVAKRIVDYREENGGISSFDELIEIEDFPAEKLDIIELYLQL